MNAGSSSGNNNNGVFHNHSGNSFVVNSSDISMNDGGCLPCIVASGQAPLPPGSSTLSSSAFMITNSHDRNRYDDTSASTLAKELAQVSVKERNDVYDEIHCITNSSDTSSSHSYVPKEENDDKFINKCIEEIKLNISKIRPKEAYNKACFLAPSKYCNNRKFHLLFLRATDYDPYVSANMIVKYFEYKVDLFGSDKVAKEITMDDLNDDDIECLQRGQHIFLNGTDAANRPIYLSMMEHGIDKSIKSQARAKWYGIMTAYRNEVVTSKGMVTILYNVGSTFSQVREHINGVPMYLSALPMKAASIHFCSDDTTIHLVISTLMKLVTKRTRLRFRHHHGGNVECQYALMSFGISPSILSVDPEGNIKDGLIEEYIERLKTWEAEADRKRLVESNGMDGSSGTKTMPDVEIATSKDVLLGRGNPYQTHPGNIRLGKIIETKQYEFNNAPRFQKTIITWEIVKFIQRDIGGRFLERDEITDTWKLCTDEVARSKVSSGFRVLSRSQRRQQQQQQQQQQTNNNRSATITSGGGVATVAGRGGSGISVGNGGIDVGSGGQFANMQWN